jgi:hypothetical protein
MMPMRSRRRTRCGAATRASASRSRSCSPRSSTSASRCAQAWEASLDGTLPLLLAEAPVAAPAPRSLVALPQEWCDWKAKQKKGAKSAPDYLRQLKTLFPEIDAKKFHVGHFTRVEVAATRCARRRCADQESL